MCSEIGFIDDKIEKNNREECELNFYFTLKFNSERGFMEIGLYLRERCAIIGDI